MMSAAEHRDVGRHILRGQSICCRQAVAEKRALCVTGACSHFPVTSFPVKFVARNRIYLASGEHLTFDFSFFLQDLVDDVKCIIGKMIVSFATKGLLLLGRAGVGKPPLACVCALAFSRRINYILYKGLSLRVCVWCSRLRVRGDGTEAGAHVIADLDDLREAMAMQPGS